MKVHAFLLVPALTVALAVVFLVPDNSGTKTSYEPLSGKAWSMVPPDAPAVAMTAAVSASTVPAAPPSSSSSSPLITKQPTQSAKGVAKRSRRAALTKRALAAPTQAARLDQTYSEARPAVSSSVAPSGVVPVSAGNVSAQEYVLEDIADRFESDESKFPLDRSADAGGVALRLIGLEKLPAMFVLKIAVINSADADFFVKGFAIEAGKQILSNRSSFRILVEPNRTREGYVLFERPPGGAIVHIKLKEDGGRGRTLEMAIPYPF
jgi:hypothetical protein